MPQWADRIWRENARTFAPAQQFTCVRTGLDYVPMTRRGEYLEHLMTKCVEPGGRVIVGTYNEETDAEGLADEAAVWGWTITGKSARRHPVDGLSYKAFWIDRTN